MNKVQRRIWIAVSVSAAILVGCISEVSESLVGADAGNQDSVLGLVLLGVNGNDNGGNVNGDNGNLNGDNGNINGANGNLNDNGGNVNGGNGNTNGSGCSGCPDFDGDGVVGQGDLGILLASYGEAPTDPCVDADGSGVVDQPDLGVLLAQFGQACPGGNGNDNGGANGNLNDNGGNGNLNDNGGNLNDNGGNGNLNDNGGNLNDNGDNGNLNDNGGNGNQNDNGGSGPCPDGSTQLYAQLSGSDNNEAEYRELVQGCRRFRARVRDLAPFTTYEVRIEGVLVGLIQTDDDGRGELEYVDGSFPPDFPDVFAGDVITIGPVSGVFGLDCSSNANCNG